MVDVPRRMPPGQADRTRHIADRAGSMRGRTRWAKPVPSRVPTSTPYTPPAASGGGPAASIRYSGRNGITFADDLPPYTSDVPQGSPGTYFAYDSTTDLYSIYFQQAGWYQVSANATVHGVTAGNIVEIEMDAPCPEVLNASYTAGSSGYCWPRVSSIPFYLDGPGYSLLLRLSSTGGVGTIDTTQICLVAF